MTEEETLQALLDGQYRGFARYGDGDFNVIRGVRERFHQACPSLARALAESLRSPSTGVLNGLIPNPRSREGSLSFQRWQMYLEVNAGIIPFLPDGPYGSSNISRMDSCPHLHTTSWWHQVSKLWRDRDICLASGSERSLTERKLLESTHAPTTVASVSCKPHDNFSQVDEIFAAITKADRETVLLCCGLTARPLVHRLVPLGFKVWDLGHVGQWFNAGHPIPLQDVPR